MTTKSTGPFRKCLADFIRKQRKMNFHTNTEIKEMIYPFCQGWTALSNEMDKIIEKKDN